jgi:DNA mismatch repair protein MutH
MLLGRTFGDIAEVNRRDGDAMEMKGHLGELLEGYYGMQSNSDPAPDFRQAGLELKCKPLKRSYDGYLYPKEPLSVGMIDYGEIAGTDRWRDIDKLRRKFLDLLIVWYGYDDGSWAGYRFLWWQRWSVPDDVDEQIQAEYETIRDRIRDGEHLGQSGSENDILQTCPKHNADFASREPGSYEVHGGHPSLERPERRSWRLPSRFLVRMLAADADLALIERGGSEYIAEEPLAEKALVRAEWASPVGE